MGVLHSERAKNAPKSPFSRHARHFWQHYGSVRALPHILAFCRGRKRPVETILPHFGSQTTLLGLRNGPLAPSGAFCTLGKPFPQSVTSNKSGFGPVRALPHNFTFCRGRKRPVETILPHFGSQTVLLGLRNGPLAPSGAFCTLGKPFPQSLTSNKSGFGPVFNLKPAPRSFFSHW